MTNMDNIAASKNRPGRKQKKHRPILNRAAENPVEQELSMLDGVRVEPVVKFDPLLDYFTP